MLPFLGEPLGTGGVARRHALVDEGCVCLTRGEVPRSTQPQPLIDGVLQVPVRRLDISVLMGVAGEVARAAQPIVTEQLLVAHGEVSTAALGELVRRRREIVRPVLTGGATEGP